jgi:two-component system, cell cycle sensor histidine kinase and response regulator CckA
MTHHQVTSDYMEHGFCFSWEPGLVWTHVASDIVTGISYFAITFALFYFASKRRDEQFHRVVLLFGAFILSCGATHFFAAYTVYVPAYWPEGIVKLLTAAISAVSAIYIIPRLPQAIALPTLAGSMAEIEKLNGELSRKNAELQLANHSIEKVLDPVYWITPEGRIQRVNDAACSALGFSRDELTALSIADIDLHSPREGWREHWETLKASVSLRYETQHRSKNGELHDVEVVANYLNYQGIECNCSTVRDISDRKERERLQAHRISTLTNPEGETADLQFADLFDLAEIQAIQDAFADATGVASLIIDPQGNPITRPSNFTRLCSELIRDTPKGLANCCRSDVELGRSSPEGPIVQPCLSGGLWDGGASICVGERQVASWLVGQVLDDSADMESLVAYAREIGVDEEAYRKALAQVTRMPIGQFKEICHTLFLLAGLLSRLALRNIQQARHIEERRRLNADLEKSEEKFRSVVESSPMGMYLYQSDPDGRLLLAGANPAADRIRGISHGDLIGRPIEEAFPELEANGSAERYRKVARGELEAQSFEAAFQGPDGAGYLDERVFRTGNDSIAVKFQDVTRRKVIELEREQLIHQLEDKTAELERFIYTVSHDLKSPLITISGFLGFLKEDFQAQDAASFESTIGRISNAAERMKQLLEELLELSRIGRKINPRQPWQLSDIVADAIEMVSGRIQESGARLEVTPGLPIVSADRQRLVQVYENLIDNAVKFSAQAEPPVVRVGVRPGAEPVFFVADNGVGIDPKYLTRIFDLFEKLDPRSSGTGVGLAIVNRIVTVHGGRMWAESEGLGLGTTFCFTLPAEGDPTT